MSKQKAFTKNFSLELEEFMTDFCPEQEVLFVRKIAMDLLADITARSPVDTGRFRSSWVVGINKPDLSQPTEIDKTGGKTLAAGSSRISQAKHRDAIYISNNVKYAIALEHGHSKQAPQGVVAVAVASARAILSKWKRGADS